MLCMQVCFHSPQCSAWLQQEVERLQTSPKASFFAARLNWDQVDMTSESPARRATALPLPSGPPGAASPPEYLINFARKTCLHKKKVLYFNNYKVQAQLRQVGHPPCPWFKRLKRSCPLRELCCFQRKNILRDGMGLRLKQTKKRILNSTNLLFPGCVLFDLYLATWWHVQTYFQSPEHLWLNLNAYTYPCVQNQWLSVC